jgi:hypothetical protein
MTIVGKILAFLTVAFSVLVGILAVMSYTARVRWADAYGKLDANYKVVTASNQVYRAENEKLLKERQDLHNRLVVLSGRQAEVKSPEDTEKVARKVVTDLGALQKEVNAQKGEIERLRGLLQAERRRSGEFETVATAAQGEVKKGQAAVDQLRKVVKDETQKNVDLVRDNNDLRDRAVAGEILAKTTQERNEELEKQVKDAERRLAQLRATGTPGAAPGGGSRAATNPPPEKVEGHIKRADPSSGLVTLTIGSDAGLTRGHTLEVFRLKPTPRYLGMVRVLEVGPSQAVAQVVGRTTGALQVGDHVSSRIGR